MASRGVVGRLQNAHWKGVSQKMHKVYRQKNSDTPAEDLIGTAGGRCNTSKAEHADGLSLTAPDQQSRDEPREVLKVADRVLVRRFPGGVQRDGS